MKIGSIVQVWKDSTGKLLGWGKIVGIVGYKETSKKTPLIKLDNGKFIFDYNN